jgi:hypothetical protein
MSPSTRTRLGCALMAFALFAAAPMAGAAVQEQAERAPACNRCKSQGVQPCKEHRGEAELEANALYCSVVDGCEACGGTGFVPCPHCDNEKARSDLALKRSRIVPARERLALLDREMGRPLRKAESEHFVLVWEMTGMKVEKKRLDEHAMLHLSVDRLEEVYADYCATLDARSFRKKVRVFVWYLPADQANGALRFCGQGSGYGVKLMGDTPTYSVCGNSQHFRGDEELHRNLVHSTAHLLFSHEDPSGWVGNQKGGWADEGLAHWFEQRYFGLCDTYCYQEQNTNVDFKGGKFRPAVRKMVAAGEEPPVGEMLEKNTDTLTLPQHAVAMSYVDYLITLDGAKFGALGRLMRAKKPTREAMQEVYGFNVLEFERRWRAWVLETYPVRE